MKLIHSSESHPVARRHSRGTRHLRGARHQRGVVLIIALIVLVSMTLAAIGMSRSIDTANLVAGNLAFKQATVQGGDIGLKKAFQWLDDNKAGTVLNDTDTTNGYFAAVPASEPIWFDQADPVWGNSVLMDGGIPDAAGNVVHYVIHRLCTSVGAYNDANQCAVTTETGGPCEGCTATIGATPPPGPPQLYYRVTTRVDGPRGAVSIVQMSVMLKVGT